MLSYLAITSWPCLKHFTFTQLAFKWPLEFAKTPKYVRKSGQTSQIWLIGFDHYRDTHVSWSDSFLFDTSADLTGGGHMWTSLTGHYIQVIKEKHITAILDRNVYKQKQIGEIWADTSCARVAKHPHFDQTRNEEPWGVGGFIQNSWKCQEAYFTYLNW